MADEDDGGLPKLTAFMGYTDRHETSSRRGDRLSPFVGAPMVFAPQSQTKRPSDSLSYSAIKIFSPFPPHLSSFHICRTFIVRLCKH